MEINSSAVMLVQLLDSYGVAARSHRANSGSTYVDFTAFGYGFQIRVADHHDCHGTATWDVRDMESYGAVIVAIRRVVSDRDEARALAESPEQMAATTRRMNSPLHRDFITRRIEAMGGLARARGRVANIEHVLGIPASRYGSIVGVDRKKLRAELEDTRRLIADAQQIGITA